jgi:hypothetical protein
MAEIGRIGSLVLRSAGGLSCNLFSFQLMVCTDIKKLDSARLIGGLGGRKCLSTAGS